MICTSSHAIWPRLYCILFLYFLIYDLFNDVSNSDYITSIGQFELLFSNLFG
jgi:hypothetical protein